jgi:hypothetical protein
MENIKLSDLKYILIRKLYYKKKRERDRERERERERNIELLNFFMIVLPMVNVQKRMLNMNIKR